jgi:hypothetical protein
MVGPHGARWGKKRMLQLRHYLRHKLRHQQPRPWLNFFFVNSGQIPLQLDI